MSDQIESRGYLEDDTKYELDCLHVSTEEWESLEKPYVFGLDDVQEPCNISTSLNTQDYSPREVITISVSKEQQNVAEMVLSNGLDADKQMEKEGREPLSRERNRLSAHRARARKKEWIKALQNQIRELFLQNYILLRENIWLRKYVMSVHRSPYKKNQIDDEGNHQKEPQIFAMTSSSDAN
jgi:hypothetical protein